MKKIPLWKVIVLPIVTIGIWSLIWIHRTAQDAAKVAKEKAPSLWYLLWPVIMIIPMFITVIYVASTTETDEEFGDRMSPIMMIYVAVILISIGTSFYYYLQWGRLLEKGSKGYVGATPATFLMFLMSWPVGIVYIQYQINKSIGK